MLVQQLPAQGEAASRCVRELGGADPALATVRITGDDFALQAGGADSSMRPRFLPGPARRALPLR